MRLAPGEFLVLFASSPTDSGGNRLDDYVDAAGHLHANFSLDAGGEYLALVKPDGQSVASEFAPEYPKQKDDIAYGVGQQANELTLLPNTAPGDYWVPAAAADLPPDWNDPFFDADMWKPFAGSLGYDTSLSAGTPTELKGYWKLNEGSGVTIDDFGGDADGTTNTIAADSSWSADAAPTTFTNPYSLIMDGTDDIIPTTFAGIAGANDRTVAAWIKTDNSSRLMTIVHWGALPSAILPIRSVGNGQT